ncbi:hypothetical protein MRX96_006197 [Rhipicephalus microplus]
MAIEAHLHIGFDTAHQHQSSCLRSSGTAYTIFLKDIIFLLGTWHPAGGCPAGPPLASTKLCQQDSKASLAMFMPEFITSRPSATQAMLSVTIAVEPACVA